MLPQDIEIKTPGMADAALLQAVATQAYSEHYADTWYDGGTWYLQTSFNIQRLLEELQDRYVRVFLINYKSTAVGFVKLNVNKPLPGSERHALELERIYLIKSASGCGIGTFVLHWVFERAVSEHYNTIWLKVMDTNPEAIRFYKKMGFTICGTHQVTFVQKKEGMRGMYIMQKPL